MLTAELALALVKKHLPVWGTKNISLQNLEDQTLASDILADRDYPPFDRVMMDGIAVSWKTYQEGVRSFKIAGVIAAGSLQTKLQDPLSCFEIMTGASLPVNADLVIPYEHLSIQDGVATVTLEAERSQMENVHLKGSDAKSGEVLLRAGNKMNGPHWGIAASVGDISPKAVHTRIHLVSTGDEIVSPEQTPQEHQIRRSNILALASSLKLHGYTDITFSHLEDSEEAIRSHYEKNLGLYDLMIYSGGVSKGKFDYLPSTWKSLGVKEIFHGIAQRPGKPLWFGVDEKNKTVVMGLPGNPVSSLVCLHKYFLSSNETYARLSEEIVFKKDLTYFVPVKIHTDKTGAVIATPLKIKNSGEFSALAESHGFIELPAEKNIFKANEAFLFHSWRPW